MTLQESIHRREGGQRTRQGHGSRLPLVSIITVVFNAKSELESISRNLCKFDRDWFEWIVIDGGSQDGTAEMLRTWDHQIDYWLSEPDDGIYDAMTKGIRQSRGTFIYHLNAGDRLLHLPIEELRAAERDQIDILSFRVKIDTGQIFIPKKGRTLRYRNTLHHQGTFYRRTAFIGYNCEYRIFADFDLNQRMVFSGAKVRLLDSTISSYSTDGISASSNTREVFSIVRSNCGVVSVVISVLLHFAYKKIATFKRMLRLWTREARA